MKTKQQERFEKAWMLTWPHNHPSIFKTYENGDYEIEKVQDTFEGFQFGEASALERAAEVCDTEWSVHRLNGRQGHAQVAEYCAKAIRALAQEVGK